MENKETGTTYEFNFSFEKGYDNETGFKYLNKTPILKPKDKIKFRFEVNVKAITLYFGWNSPFKNTHIHLKNIGGYF